MLSYDSLMQQTRERGMPDGKVRAAAREYFHILTLKAIYGLPQSSALVFIGGTALRLGYNLQRFSEDLDFNVKGLSLREWKIFVEDAAHGLSRQGFSVEAKTAEKGSLLTGDLRCGGFLQSYNLTKDPKEKLKIKVEANRPDYPLKTEPRVVTGYGEMAAVPFAAPGLMAAEKILALLQRELGRDIYDIFFMAGRKWKPDRRILMAKGIQKNPADAILERVKSLGQKRLSDMARRLEPFLFEYEQAKLVADAHRLLPSALEYLEEG